MADYGDDEFGRESRDQFGRDRRRSPVRDFSPETMDDRIRRSRSSRSRSPDRFAARRRYRSPSPRRRSFPHGDNGDHYIPDYTRDGYRPGPRFGDDDARDRDDNRFDPYKLDYMVSFRQFADYVNNRTRGRRYDDRDLSEQYAAYKRDCTKRQCKKFYEAHKEMAWFREKYHPMERRRWLDEVRTIKIENYKQFKEDAEAGNLDNISLDEGGPIEASVMDIDAEAESDTILFVKSITPAIGRDKVVEMCKSVENFRYLAVSDPNALKRFHRIGWIVFNNGADIKSAFDKLNNQKIEEFEFHLGFHKLNSNTKPRYAPEVANHPARLRKDLSRISDIVTVLDDEVAGELNGIEVVNALFERVCATRMEAETNGTMESIDLWKTKKQLDLFIEYLRRVHMFCYYCGIGADSPMDLERRCPIHHFRKRGDAPDSYSDKWTRALDTRLDFKDRPAHKIDVEALGGKAADDVWDYMAKIADQRYACTMCNKQFLGPEFVIKHLGNKHSINVEDLVEKQFYNNYIRDPNRLMPNVQPPTAVTPVPNMTPTLLNSSNGTNNGIGINPSVALTNDASSVNAVSSGYQPYAIGWETNTFIPQIAAAPVGTPMDQIPRIGFEPPTASPSLSLPAATAAAIRTPTIPMALTGGMAGIGALTASSNAVASAVSQAASQLALDPRQNREVTSYVDLDAPVEGDLELNYG
ncbi:hypothetical protein BDF22DRAFT_474611 [Syncephalis plumigaleata]|nr:hypothetical protein BDF22DRAFT_474611 [Syncephalis plumigaleata]